MKVLMKPYCFKELKFADAKAFLGAAGSMDDYPFALASEAAVLEEYKVESSGIVLFKNLDEERNDLEGEVTEEAIVLFLSGNAIPLVAEFNQETAQKIFSGVIKSHLLLFISSAAEDFSAKVDIAKAIAKDHKGEMIFVKINTDEEDHKRIMELFGLDESELPLMRILKFKPEQN